MNSSRNTHIPVLMASGQRDRHSCAAYGMRHHGATPRQPLPKRVSQSRALWKGAIGLLAMVLAVTMAHAQASPHYLGTITAINGNTLTVKTAQGDQTVTVPSTAQLKRIEPGQLNLSAAVNMSFSELAVGDRVLVNLDPNASTPQALRVIAIKHEDLAKRQEEEREDWKLHGVGGLVKSVDPATGTIVLAAGAGPVTKTLTIHTTQATVLKRYAPASVNYDLAQPAPITAIHAGDQLMARGPQNADGTEMTAVEVVSGSFRNISGMVMSLDTANSTMVVKDLATKKNVTVHVPADTQMRLLPERMAQMLAMRLNRAAGGGRGANAGPPNGGGGGFTHGGEGRRGEGGRGEMNPEQLLSRAPLIHLTDLKKGEAVMLVSTSGTSDVTAITVVAGVEPLLRAPASQDLLASWSMNTSAPAEAGADQ